MKNTKHDYTLKVRSAALPMIDYLSTAAQRNAPQVHFLAVYRNEEKRPLQRNAAVDYERSLRATVIIRVVSLFANYFSRVEKLALLLQNAQQQRVFTSTYVFVFTIYHVQYTIFVCCY